MSKEIEFTPGNFVDESVKAFEKFAVKSSSTILFKCFVTYYAEHCSKKVQGIGSASTVRHAREYFSDEAFNFFEHYIVKLAKVMQEKPNDYLGQIYQRLNANNRNLGQIFTPFHISYMMAKMTTIYDGSKLTNGKVQEVLDPCCGAGSLLLGAGVSLLDQGVNVLDFVLIGQDIDEFCAAMCYLQLTALGVAGVVKVGNSLTDEVTRIYYTPVAAVQKIALANTKVKEGTADKDDLMISDVISQMAPLILLKELIAQ